ncbi:hypothetical protein IV203_020581 [Nitzschia inconspicua]|uniref:Uncharacterized protein n=1 Tax=Nitzschia inconspicua TaxID=303405 RepID=A0A9K3KFQ5_9STRA|nr:hypothetical protein IV203_020581 [Nitzschia inconspicua]
MKISASTWVLFLSAVAMGSNTLAFHQSPSSTRQPMEESRRAVMEKALATFGAVTTAATVVGLPSTFLLPSPASASGGATAGKYTTIPIAKRRYYGRVQAGVHEFLALGPKMIEADMSAATIQRFFDPQGLVVVEAKRQDINGQCTKKDGACKGKEVRDSIYNDMKASMYLLGNAFRINQTKAPDNLPTVKAAKAFFKEMDLVEKAAQKGRPGDREAVGHYAAALDILDSYLDLVELPPTNSGWYDQEFSRAVGDSARIT